MAEGRYEGGQGPGSVNNLSEILGPVSEPLSKADDSLQGYDYEFLPPPDPKYECPICLLILREPQQTPCGHRFCKYCICTWLSESERRCPVDNEAIGKGQIFPDNFAKREILNLNVACSNSKRGCDNVLILKEIEKHLEVCPCGLISCSNGCGEIFLRSEVSDHMIKICRNRTVLCTFCDQSIRAGSEEVYDHVRNDCLEAPTNCWFQRIGCAAQLKRSEIPRHMQDGIHVHMTLLATGMEKILERLGIQHLDGSTESVYERLPQEATTGVADLISSTQRLANICSSSYGTEQTAQNELSAPPSTDRESRLGVEGSSFNIPVLAPSDNRLGSPSLSFAGPSQVGTARTSADQPVNTVERAVMGPPASSTGQSQSLPIVSEDANNNLSGPEYFSDTFVRTSSSGSSESGGQYGERIISYGRSPSEDNYAIPSTLGFARTHLHKTYGRSPSFVHQEQVLHALSMKSNNNEKSNQDLRSRIKVLDNIVADFEGRSCDGIYIWKIRNYDKLRADAKIGINSAIHSPSIYSSFYGYKLCMRVNLNGVQEGLGKDLSIFIHFMQGEFDDVLDWPFKGRITITILDQNPKCDQRRPISETLIATQSLAAFQRPTSHRNHKGFGYMEFIPFKRLDNSNYVRNKTLMIKVHIIPLNN